MNIRLILPALSMAVTLSGYAADFSLTSRGLVALALLSRINPIAINSPCGP